jgi:uncharacterized coiled-coil DUF342 family protein
VKQLEDFIMAQPTKQLAFAVDDEILAVIEQLKKELGANTAAAVFRKALAVTKLAADQARTTGGVVDIKGRGEDDRTGISVALRA